MTDATDQADRDRADLAILNFEVDDVAIEIAAASAGTVPTGSVNIVPPNCCVDTPAPKAR